MNSLYLWVPERRILFWSTTQNTQTETNLIHMPQIGPNRNQSPQRKCSSNHWTTEVVKYDNVDLYVRYTYFKIRSLTGEADDPLGLSPELGLFSHAFSFFLVELAFSIWKDNLNAVSNINYGAYTLTAHGSAAAHDSFALLLVKVEFLRGSKVRFYRTELILDAGSFRCVHACSIFAELLPLYAKKWARVV